MRLLLLAATLLVATPALAQQLLTGHNSGTAPSNNIGNESNWYLDIDTSNIWFKSFNQWSASGSLNNSLGTLLTCAAGTNTAPVATGQVFRCNGFVVVAQ